MTLIKPKGPCSNIYNNRHLRLTDSDKEYLEKQGGVYFIQSGDFVKIGVSSNVKARLQTLQTAHFRKLKILHVIACCDSGIIEKALHQHFKKFMTESKNEWFYFDADLKEFIATSPTKKDALLFLTNSKVLTQAQKKHLAKARSLLDQKRADIGYLNRNAAEAAQKSEAWGLTLLNPKAFENDGDFHWTKQIYSKLEAFFDHHWKYDVAPFHCGNFNIKIQRLKEEVKYLELLQKKGFSL